MSSHVTTDMTVRVTQPEGPAVPVAAQLRYDARDPFAVILEFRVTHERTVSWALARDLLRDGIDAPAGLGDARIAPPVTRRGPLTLTLSGRDGVASFELPRAPVLAFLARTYTAVPIGDESRYVDTELDAFLAELTDTSPID
jgi:hypothetical protein